MKMFPNFTLKSFVYLDLWAFLFSDVYECIVDITTENLADTLEFVCILQPS